MVRRPAGLEPRRELVRSSRLLVRVAVLLAWLGCEPAEERSTWPIALRQVGACPVGMPMDIELFALGDFPGRSYHLQVDGHDDVPLDDRTREVLVSVTTARGSAEGRRARSARADEAAQALWVLGSGPSCPLGDEFLEASDGAVVAALPEGGALIAGGLATDTLASSDAYLLVEGSETRVDVNGGMLLRRAFASATLVDDGVVIAGGTPDLRAGAHDTYELYEFTSGRFSAARSGKLDAARMQHAALLLADGRVLLAGGRVEADGDPLASAELLDPVSGVSEPIDARMSLPRVAPMAARLDSGRVLIVGGRDAAGRALDSIEVYSPDEQSFALALTGLPVREEVSAAVLPGARIAWLTCDHVDADGGASCELSLIAEREGELQVSAVALDFTGLVPNGLKQMQLIYAGDGQLLWTGADDSDPTGRRRAFVIDPVTQTLSRVDASRVPSQLVRLSNDLVFELDESGASLRAAFTRGRYASPEGDLLEDLRRSLILDAPAHWSSMDDGLQARAPAARFDLGELRFAAFDAAARVDGDFSVVVYDGLGGGAELSVRGGELRTGEGTCRSQLQDGVLELRRAGERLVVGAGCSVSVPAAALGIAFVLDEGARVRELRLERR